MGRSIQENWQGDWALCAVLCIIVASGCSRAPDAKRYDLKGRVVSVDQGRREVTLDHEAIPGLMAAMTMPYTVQDARLLSGLTAGDQVSAQLVVSGQTGWLENIVVVKKGEGAAPEAATELQAPRPGQEVPGFELVNQDGKQVNFSQYRGKAVLLTFLYTSCPLPEKGADPDGCSLLTRNFAEIDHNLAKDPNTFSETRLLSVSFDPRHDTPKVLRDYGATFVAPGKHPFNHWQFAVVPQPGLGPVAKFFGLFYQSEGGGQFVHSMSTAVISPEGKIYRWYQGEDWKPADVTRDLLDSLSGARLSS